MKKINFFATFLIINICIVNVCISMDVPETVGNEDILEIDPAQNSAFYVTNIIRNISPWPTTVVNEAYIPFLVKINVSAYGLEWLNVWVKQQNPSLSQEQINRMIIAPLLREEKQAIPIPISILLNKSVGKQKKLLNPGELFLLGDGDGGKHPILKYESGRVLVYHATKENNDYVINCMNNFRLNASVKGVADESEAQALFEREVVAVMNGAVMHARKGYYPPAPVVPTMGIGEKKLVTEVSGKAKNNKQNVLLLTK